MSMNLSPVTIVALVENESNPSGITLVHSDRTNVAADPNDIVELAKLVKKGDEFVRANAGNKLMVIADQIRYLQQQAQKVLQDAKRDADLHHAACNMVKKPGTMYYLFKRPSGQRYFSMISPKEWGKSFQHEYLGAYRLEHDFSWTLAKDVEERARNFAAIDKVLNSQVAITYDPNPNFNSLTQTNQEKADSDSKSKEGDVRIDDME